MAIQGTSLSFDFDESHPFCIQHKVLCTAADMSDESYKFNNKLIMIFTHPGAIFIYFVSFFHTRVFQPCFV